VEIRHLRCFIAVAEELHFARAAERLHIEQSPLSRAIKELEYDLKAQLFERTTRSTRLTWAGQVFLADVLRIFAAIDQARADVKSAVTGYHGKLRIALSDGIAPSRLAAFLALCRAQEPEVEIRLFQIPFAQQVKGLRDDLYDAGFAQWADVGEGIIAEPVWADPLVVAVPARHPLLMQKQISLEEMLRYPLVLFDPEKCEGVSRQIERVLCSARTGPRIAEHVSSHDLLLTLIAAGYGVGLTTAIQIDTCRLADVVVRPLADQSVVLTTYLLRPNIAPSMQLSHFIGRVKPVETAAQASPP
jgi:DNA-binding transcriptional LysR family regulator